MTVAAWKKYAQVGVLAVSLMGMPLVSPAGAQQQTPPPTTDTPRMDMQDERGFPWGLLGLLGLIGLAGMRKRHNEVDRLRRDEPTRRAV
jgi:MYXO-CTERM domain-containing protein